MPPRLASAAAEGCLSGLVAGAVTVLGLSIVLDTILLSRHGLGMVDVVVLLGAPFAGAAAAKRVLPASGGVSTVWLGSACLAGMMTGMYTRPWIVWGPERFALQNTVWVLASIVSAGCAAGIAARWFALWRDRAVVA